MLRLSSISAVRKQLKYHDPMLYTESVDFFFQMTYFMFTKYVNVPSIGDIL